MLRVNLTVEIKLTLYSCLFMLIDDFMNPACLREKELYKMHRLSKRTN